MGKDHRGQPSGLNKGESPTGTPSKLSPEDIKENQEISQKHGLHQGEMPDHMRENNPNRNTDKTDATNAGGYKN